MHVCGMYIRIYSYMYCGPRRVAFENRPRDPFDPSIVQFRA